MWCSSRVRPVISLRLGFRRDFLSVLHPNLISSPIKGILEIFNLTPRCIPMDILDVSCCHHLASVVVVRRKLFQKSVQHVKIYLPCNFEVNPITHFDRLCKLEKKNKTMLMDKHNKTDNLVEIRIPKKFFVCSSS
jgi:hypothetical protein